MQQSTNIKVVCRVRPFNEAELREDSVSCVEVRSSGAVRVNDPCGKLDPIHFSFDLSFGPDTKQPALYKEVVEPLVALIFEGVNVTVMAYGQTSSGKTYTMQGYSVESKGVIPRLLGDVFGRVSLSPPQIEFRMKFSVVEVYNEKVRDLLTSEKTDLKVRESRTLGIYVEGVSEVYVTSADEALKLLALAAENRSVSATRMNELSSRSHLLAIFSIYQSDLADHSAKSSRVMLVDLAGSEKVGKTGAEGRVLDQAKMIGKSLSSLGMVIFALSDGKPHIPYRDSKLTRILQESLGGNSRTVLIATCSPSPLNHQETLSTLRFANRAKQIRNKPKVNRQYTLQQLLILLERAETKIADQAKTIRELERQLRTNTDSPDKRADQELLVEDKELAESLQAFELERAKRDELESRVRQLENMEEEARASKEELQAERERSSRLRNEVESLMKKVEVLESCLSKNVARKESGESELVQLSKTVMQLEERLKKANVFEAESRQYMQEIAQSVGASADVKRLLQENMELRGKTAMLEDYVQRANQFHGEKEKVYLDLKNRVEKVIQLEETLDEARERTQFLEALLSQKDLGGRLLKSEARCQQLSRQMSELKVRQFLWKNQSKFYDQRLDRKDQRIAELEEELAQSRKVKEQAKDDMALRAPKPVVKMFSAIMMSRT